jgi:hypothetical protein
MSERCVGEGPAVHRAREREYAMRFNRLFPMMTRADEDDRRIVELLLSNGACPFDYV